MRRTRLRRVSKKRQARMGEWRQARDEVARRAAGLCEVRQPGCESWGGHAHHILRRSQGGSDDPSNLLWVCWRCHEEIHRNPKRSYAQGFLARSEVA